MTDFETCFQWTMGFEGKTLSEAPGDSGGMTWWGIARNYFPTWRGWLIVDEAVKACEGNLRQAAVALEGYPSLDALTRAFYQTIFDHYLLGQLNDGEVGLQVFDAVVNMGGEAIGLFQEILNVPKDFMMGPVTVAAANGFTGTVPLAQAFISRRKEHYQAIVADHPEDAPFLKSWLSRCVLSS